MSIKLYTGRMGSGKTYEVVTEVILNALRRGRRVVTNIAGLKYELFVDLLVSEGVKPEDIGQIVSITHEQVTDATFWRNDKEFTTFFNALIGKKSEAVDYFIQPGDLLALDEIWRFWGGLGKVDSEGHKRPASVMNFFRMHRHFIHEKTGVACDVALITQDVMDLSRDVRSVVEETYYMEKLTAIGSSKRYRVDIHQGGKVTRKPLRQLQRSYNPDYFPLYSSHSQKKEGGADAVEENIDGRGNILKGLMFKVVLPLMIPLLIGAVWVVWGFFHPKETKEADKITSSSEVKPGESSPQKKQTDPLPPEPDQKYKVVGWYTVGGVQRVILTDGSESRFIVAPPAIKLTSVSTELMLPEGVIATSWTGGKKQGAFIPKAGQ